VQIYVFQAGRHTLGLWGGGRQADHAHLHAALAPHRAADDVALLERRQFIRSDDPQSFFGLRGGGIGWGLPAAIGVKLALPDRPVVALIGDGSAMYTCQALWTAAHDRIPVVFVILNNTSYRILKQRLVAIERLRSTLRTFERVLEIEEGDQDQHEPPEQAEKLLGGSPR